ncbi:MAG: hypothetical protein M3347_18885, partial [Armatimonadota bacterium]|nr:hypothetical protein [Armatimonadota bacterium]
MSAVFHRCSLAVVVVVLCLTWPAFATVLLQPTGDDAIPLRTKSLNAHVTIERQFATTDLEMTFQNETRNRVEADFIYTVPPGAVVTYFAYWFGNEKVIARIVEKERATAIYQYITAPPRQRDPALVELIGKNLLRARIFPVEPNADLRVEIRMVQVLSSDRQGAIYTFALKPEEEGKGTFDSLKISALVKPDVSIDGVANNYNLPVTKDSEGYRLSLEQRTYRPRQDLQIHLMRKQQPLHVALYAARSGGADGFFALALTPSRSVTKPTVTINGLATYQVVPSKLPSLQAHETILVCGRYKGSGAATVALAGATPQGRWAASQQVVFGAQRQSNNLATKLWAARRIEHLSDSLKLPLRLHEARNREAIEETIELSHRFTLPSRFTSWLAVPRAELERYQREQAFADVYFYGRLLALEIAQGRENGRAARRLRQQLNRVCRIAGYTPQQVLQDELSERVEEVASAWVREKYRDRPNRRRMTQLRYELNRLARVTGVSVWRQLRQTERYTLSPILDEIADALVQERHRAKPNRKRISALRNRLQRLARVAGTSPKAHWQRAEAARLRIDLDRVTQQWGEEIIAGHDESARAQQLRQQFERFERTTRQLPGRLMAWDMWHITRRPREAYSARAHDLAYQIVKEKKAAAPDAQKLAALERELARLSPKAGASEQDIIAYETSRLGWDDRPINMRE